MAQEHRPCPKEEGNNPTNVTPSIHTKSSTLGTYKKLTYSFPLSGSVQDLRHFATDKKDVSKISPSSRKAKEDCDEDLKNETGSSNTTENPSTSNAPRQSGWKRFFKLWKKSSIKPKLPSIPSLVPKLSRRKGRSARESVETDQRFTNSSWKNFTLSQLQTATNNFNKENLIGKGGYAEVYKGCLPNGQHIAIKRLNKEIEEEHVLNFLSEIGIIAHINHPNTAKMVGYGVEGGAYLVLQLSSLGSLSSLLHGDSKEKLNWSMRYKIILGTAEGLLYLHQHCRRRIIHRDIKADNILLSEDFEPQICDFGLSKWLPKQWSHHNATKFEGTFGYFAPEYFMHGIVDEKTDIFSLGVLFLEVITGRQALDETRKSLVLWAKPLLENNSVMELIDPCLGNNYDPEEMGWVISTATLCIEHNPVFRPRMSQVVTLLKGNDEKLNYLDDECRKQFRRRTYSEELSCVREYNLTKNLMSSKH